MNSRNSAIAVALLIFGMVAIVLMSKDQADFQGSDSESLGENLVSEAIGDSDSANSIQAAEKATPANERLELEAPTVPNPDSDQTAAFGWTGVVTGENGEAVPGIEVFNSDPWTYYDFDEPLKIAVTDSSGQYFIPWPRELEWRSAGDMSLRIADPTRRSENLTLPKPSTPPAIVNLRLLPEDTVIHLTLLHLLDHEPAADIGIVLTGSGWNSFGVTDSQGRLTLAAAAGEGCEMELHHDDPGDLEGPWPLQIPDSEIMELQVFYDGPPEQVSLQATQENRSTLIAPASFETLDEYDELSGLLASSPTGRHDWQQQKQERFGLHYQVSAEGYLPTRVHLNSKSKDNPFHVPLAEATARDIDIHLTRAGEPAPDVKVEIQSKGALISVWDADKGAKYESETWSGGITHAHGTSDEKGLIHLDLQTRLDQFPIALRLLVTEPGTEQREVAVLDTRKLGPMPWSIEIQPSMATLEFAVTNSNGSPIQGESISVWLQPNDESPIALRGRHVEYPEREFSNWDRDGKGITNVDGIFRMEVPAPSGFAWRKGRGEPVSDKQPLLAGEVRRIELQSEIGLSIIGKVLTADGKVWVGPGIALQLRQPNGEHLPGLDNDKWFNGPSWSRSNVSNDDGSFHFMGVPPGQYRIQAWTVPLQNPELAVFEAGTESIDLRLEPLNRVSLTVIDADTGLPVPGEGNFHVFDPEGFWYWSTLWDGKGAVNFPTFGETWVEVIYTGYRPTVESIGDWNNPGDTREVQLEVKRGRTVHFEIKPEESRQRIRRLLLTDFDANDPRQNRLRFRKGDDFALLNGTTFDAMTVRAVDENNEQIGKFFSIPAGKEELTLQWDLDQQ